jgi:DegV family protein with EDD domain
MNSVRIVADSGCDIPASLAAEHDIAIVPCLVRFDQETVYDSDMSPDQFWTRARQSARQPGTSAPPPSVYQQMYERHLNAGHDVLCLTLPDNYSTSYDNALLAAQEYGSRVRVLDSGSISLGMGLQALAAARQALAGATLNGLYSQIEDMRHRTSVLFVLDTVEWARRGGRVQRILPLIDRVARTFNVKPIVELIDGEMRLLGVSRSYRNAIQRLEDEVRARLPLEAAATAYTRGREYAIDLSERLGRLTNAPSNTLLMTEAGPVFAAHAGPNALGAVVVRA